MTDYAAHPEFVALTLACHRSPEDDAQRLILADWLQEHGHERDARWLRGHNLFALTAAATNDPKDDSRAIHARFSLVRATADAIGTDLLKAIEVCLLLGGGREGK